MVPLIVLQRIISMKCNFFLLLQVMAQQQLNQLEGRVERPWFRAAVFLPVDPRVMPEDILPTILGPEEELLYRRRFLSIRTYQRESPRGFASLYNFWLPDQDSLQQTRHHLDMIFQRQATAFRWCNTWSQNNRTATILALICQQFSTIGPPSYGDTLGGPSTVFWLDTGTWWVDWSCWDAAPQLSLAGDYGHQYNILHISHRGPSPRTRRWWQHHPEEEKGSHWRHIKTRHFGKFVHLPLCSWTSRLCRQATRHCSQGIFPALAYPSETRNPHTIT